MTTNTEIKSLPTLEEIVNNYFLGINKIPIIENDIESEYLAKNDLTSVELYHNIFYSLLTTPKTNDKKAILKEFKNFTGWYKFLQYVYDDVNYKYFKTSLPKNIEIDEDAIMTDDLMDDFYDCFDKMNTGDYRGKASDVLLENLLTFNSPELKDLAACALKRELIKCKVGATIINDVYGRLIRIAPYQRCEKEPFLAKRIKYPCMAQTKEDGLFLNKIINVSNIDPIYNNVEESKGISTSRYGRILEENFFLRCLNNIVPNGVFSNFVVHGEGLIRDPENPGKFYPREVGNGFINSFTQRVETQNNNLKLLAEAKSPKTREKIQNKIDEDFRTWKFVSKNLVFRIWDIVDLSDWLNLSSEQTVTERFELAKEFVRKWEEYKYSLNSEDKDRIGNCNVELIDYRILHSEKEVMHYYNDHLENGLEGIIVKNLDCVWKNSTNTSGIIKLKEFKDCDLLVTGWNPGEGEFEGGIGSLICESADGLLQVNISGMKREMRGLERVDLNDSSKGIRPIENFNFDHYTGKVIAIKYNALIESETKPGLKSLFIPNIIEVRDPSDKPKADLLSEIKK